MGHQSNGEPIISWSIATVLLLSMMQSAAAAAPDFKNAFCNANKDCKLTSKSCVKSCPKQGYGSSSGPLCAASYCFGNTCVKQGVCSGKKCRADKDCATTTGIKCAACVKGKFPACTVQKCNKGFCTTIQSCSLDQATPPPIASPPPAPPVPAPPPANQACKKDLDCKVPGPILCAQCVLPTPGAARGPPCQQTFCFQNTTCVKQPICSGIACSSDADCANVASKLCALCIKGKFPFCTTSQCTNGFCATIEPCSLTSP